VKLRLFSIIMSIPFLFGLFGCGPRSPVAITSVESMSLTLHGMRGSSVYEITQTGESLELCLYRLVYSGEETSRRLEARVIPDAQEFLALMNSCKVQQWDGFHGKHPKNVSDGIMFNFTAEVNGGQVIRADGSANFPKGYHEFVRTLNEMLRETGEDDQRDLPDGR